MRTKRVEKICQICGKVFDIKLSRHLRGECKYCSNECRIIGATKTRKLNHVYSTFNCDYCGKETKRKPSHIKKWKKNYCCVECMAESYKKQLLGKANPNYKNGLALDVCKYNADWQKKKKKSDPKFRLRTNVGLRIYKALRQNKAGWSWEKLVGYTLKDLIKHLEKKFKPGMTWENYGKWHIDHIIPVVAFNYSKPEHRDFKRCWALKNLQPLWASDNSKKGDSLEKPFQPSLKL